MGADPGPSDLVARGYDAFYATWGRSPTLRRIWREHVTGNDYPEEFSHISFVPLVTLRSLCAGLRLKTGQLLVDLACGAGGPGLWVAGESGARVLGRDLSRVAVQRARERAVALGMEGRAEFGPGTFEATGIASGSADAVMSVDALQYAPSKAEAMIEAARILRRGGRLGFTAFELEPDRVAGGAWDDPVPDYRPVLEQARFQVVSYGQMPNWRGQVAAAYGAVLEEQVALTSELGDAAAAALVMEAAITLRLEPYCGHVLAVATRP